MLTSRVQNALHDDFAEALTDNFRKEWEVKEQAAAKDRERAEALAVQKQLTLNKVMDLQIERTAKDVLRKTFG